MTKSLPKEVTMETKDGIDSSDLVGIGSTRFDD